MLQVSFIDDLLQPKPLRIDQPGRWRAQGARRMDETGPARFVRVKLVQLSWELAKSGR